MKKQNPKLIKFEFGGELVFKKESKWGGYKQRYYKMVDGKNLDAVEDKINDIIDDIFSSDYKPKYVLTTCKVKLPDGSITHVSDTLTYEAFETLQELEETAIDRLTNTLAIVDLYRGMQILDTSIRFVYEDINSD